LRFAVAGRQRPAKPPVLGILAVASFETDDRHTSLIDESESSDNGRIVA
jgi:hypothetical protein